MANGLDSFIERYRVEEYTGENRCIPCTIVNVVIAAAVGAVVGIATTIGGVFVFLASLVAIYVRGYLIPGTPTWTKRYLPDRVLALFDKDPERLVEDSSGPAVEEFETAERIRYRQENRIAPDSFLVDVGAITDPDDGDRELTDEFASIRQSKLEAVSERGVDMSDIARLFGAEEERIEDLDRDYPAVKVVRRIRKWPAEGALVADVATDLALRELTDRWDPVPVAQKVDILKSMRYLIEACPACGGSIELTEETVESCCRLYPVVQLRCQECALTVAEMDAENVDTKTVDWDLAGDPGVLKRI